MAEIYILNNIKNNKKYVGQTTRLSNKRIKSHIRKKSIIGLALKKYGEESFQKFIFFVPEFLLDDFEVELIKKLDCISPKGYNLDSGGNKNKHHCNETKKKISESHKGKIIGKVHSEEWKNKLSKRMSGKNNPQYGKKYTKETKEKMSNSQSGKHIGIKNAMYGRKGKLSPQSKKIICVETKEVFDSIVEAGLHFNIKCNSCISLCCTGKRKTSGGYHWRYYNDK